jgi:hypothetical protein
MSKITCCVLSMLIGALLALSVSGNHTVMVVHAEGDTVCRMFGPRPATSPTVPPLSCHFHGNILEGNSGTGSIPLDGATFEGGTIKNATFVYSGGTFAFDNVKVDPGTIRLDLEGAAANTVRFLALWQNLGRKPLPNEPRNQNVPTVKTISITEPTTLNFN